MSGPVVSLNGNGARRHDVRCWWAARAVYSLALGILLTMFWAWLPSVQQCVFKWRHPSRYYMRDETMDYMLDESNYMIANLYSSLLVDRTVVGHPTYDKPMEPTARGSAITSLPAWHFQPPSDLRRKYEPAQVVRTTTTASGLPWRCAIMSYSAVGNQYGLASRGEWMVFESLTSYLQLPIRPYWPGLIRNVLFWATLSAVPIMGFPMLRRALRRRRGQCVQCKYPMPEASARGRPCICPECGWQGSATVKGVTGPTEP